MPETTAQPTVYLDAEHNIVRAPDFALQGRLAAELERQQQAKALRVPRIRWDNELVVYVWRGGLKGRIGHAAVKIHRKVGTDQAKHYISWWPGDSKRGEASNSFREDRASELRPDTQVHLRSGEFQARAGQTIFHIEKQDRHLKTATGEQVVSRMYLFGQEPDLKVALPAQGSSPFGLFGRAAFGWFQHFSDANNQDGYYKMVSRHHNCAGVVRQALKFAGAEAFVPAPLSILYASPNEIADFAEALSAKILEYDRRAQDFVRLCGTTVAAANETLGVQQQNLLISPTQWREVSGRRDGKRGQNVRSLDLHLLKMHEGLYVATAGNSDHKAARDGRVKYLKHKKEAFKLIERAVLSRGRHRDSHDLSMLTALGCHLVG